MSNYQVSLTEEPDWGPPADYANLEPPDEPNDEPPNNWEIPENILTALSVDTANPSLDETVPDFQTQLADLQRQMELNEANENTIERTYLDEQLSEQQEELLTDLGLAASLSEALPVELEASEDQAPSGLSSRDELVARANHLGLSDARFMGKTDRDTEGNVIGQTIQAIEIYSNGVISGSVLDVGHYTNQVDAEEEYSQLQ